MSKKNKRPTNEVRSIWTIVDKYKERSDDLTHKNSQLQAELDLVREDLKKTKQKADLYEGICERLRTSMYPDYFRLTKSRAQALHELKKTKEELNASKLSASKTVLYLTNQLRMESEKAKTMREYFLRSDSDRKFLLARKELLDPDADKGFPGAMSPEAFLNRHK
jgi:hypothetical protein